MEKKIVVVVSGGQVTNILGTGDLSDVSVELIDLDRPAFETPEEEAVFDALEKRVDDLENDPAWTSIM